MQTPWSQSELLRAFDADFDALVTFAAASRCPGGFGTLDADGVITEGAAVELWITCRMTYVFSLAAMRGSDDARALAEHGVAALAGPFFDEVNGGWYSALCPGDDPQPQEGTRKEAYAHAFVILATAAAALAGIDGAKALLDTALADQDEHWWEPSFGRVRNSWNLDYSECEGYRGLNANMHTVEAYLAAWDATGQRVWLDRAREICRFVAELGADFNWRLPEHFAADWTVQPQMFSDNPADPFRPYGATPGHGFEWARLILHTRAALIAIGDEPSPWMLDVSRSLISRADEDAWDDGAVGGLVYTTDFDGAPVVRTRMHWVACEAVNAAYAMGVAEESLGNAQGVGVQAERFARFVAWADEYLHEGPGRWIHEVAEDGTPSTVVWPGKPDAYHVAQMLLLPTIGLAPGFAAALAARA